MEIYRPGGKLIFVTVLSVSMAFLETSVVVYLRELYYPHGFGFPLITMSNVISVTELFRELATMLMLISIGYLAGRNGWQRFAWFLYSFAIWDIFYYVFLKVLIHWPASWFTWDILFLLPVIWTGPVLAPVIVSFTMILLAFVILYVDRSNEKMAVQWQESLLVLAGAVIIFISFIFDFINFLIAKNSLVKFFSPSTSPEILRSYIPVSFNWMLLTTGEILILAGIFVFLSKNKRNVHA